LSSFDSGFFSCNDTQEFDRFLNAVPLEDFDLSFFALSRMMVKSAQLMRFHRNGFLCQPHRPPFSIFKHTSLPSRPSQLCLHPKETKRTDQKKTINPSPLSSPNQLTLHAALSLNFPGGAFA